MTRCLEYRGPHSPEPRPYGRPYIDGIRVYLHRWIVEQVEGPLAPGEVVRHKCDNPACFLYDHLERGTAADNQQDSVRRGRHWNTRKTHCKHGHPFDKDNTGRDSRGHRVCLECRALAKMREQRKRWSC